MSKTPRLDFYEYGALMAYAASGRSTCPRAHVGCALFNSKGVVVATGYNGAPRKKKQCDEAGCRMRDGHCVRARHAERNACRFAHQRSLVDGYAFATIRPCRPCFDTLVEQGITHIFYLEDYRNELAKDHIDAVCLAKGIQLEKLSFNITDTIKKSIDFHKNAGGLLAKLKDVTMTEK